VRAEPRRRAARALAAAAAVLLSPGIPRALECPAPPRADPRLAAMPAEQRIAHLRLRLEAGRSAAEAWAWTWGIVDGAFTVGQLAAAPSAGSTAKQWAYVAGAASSALGVVQVLTVPLAPERVPDLGGGCAELARLEGSLERSARNAELSSGWVAQLGNVVVNAAVGVAFGLADHRWQTGAVTAGIGWAIGEVQILTVPKGLVRDLERYRAGDAGAAADAGGAGRITAAGLGRGRGAGVTVAVRF
jgi:hypothetical protein